MVLDRWQSFACLHTTLEFMSYNLCATVNWVAAMRPDDGLWIPIVVGSMNQLWVASKSSICVCVCVCERMGHFDWRITKEF